MHSETSVLGVKKLVIDSQEEFDEIDFSDNKYYDLEELEI
jgi:hypothetical protein